MKFFLAIALIVAVASAGVMKPTGLVEEVQQIQEIIAAIQSPSTDPATAALLEQLLLDTLGMEPVSVGPAIVNPVSPVAVVDGISPVAVVDGISPIAVGPAIVDAISPISVGPAIIDFPLPEGALGEVVATPVSPVVETPVAPAAAAENSPLVQIIVNVNGAAVGANPVTVTPGAAAESVVGPAVVPVHVVEEAEFIPAPVVLPLPVIPEPIIPEPVVLPPPPAVFPLPIVAPEPVIVVEAPKPEPISVGTPVLPVPVAPVVLPETLN